MQVFSPIITGSLEVTGSTTITGSLNVSSGITGSLLGTASYAINASPGSGFPFSGSASITGSLNISGSGLTVSGSVKSDGGFTGSLQGTSSFASNAAFSSISLVAITATNAFTASYVPTASYANRSTTASYSTTSSYALFAVGSTVGPGTTNKLAKFTSTNIIGDSAITDTGVGAVGIGTSFPQYTLDVSGYIRSSNYIYIGGAGASEYAMEIGKDRTGNGYAYVDFIGDTTYTDYGLRVIRGATGANATSSISHRGNGPLIMETLESSSISFKTNGSNRLTIGSFGNIGIGTVSPSFKLHVYGDSRFENDVYISNLNYSVQPNIVGFDTTSQKLYYQPVPALPSYATVDQINEPDATDVYVRPDKLEESKHTTINIYNFLNFS